MKKAYFLIVLLNLFPVAAGMSNEGYVFEDFDDDESWVVGPGTRPGPPVGTRTIIEDGYFFESDGEGMTSLLVGSSTDGKSDYVVRSRIHMKGPNNSLFAGIGGRRAGEPLAVNHGGISAVISESGNVLLVYIDENDRVDILGNADTEIDRLDKDVFLQFGMLGDQFNVTAWLPGQPKPAAQISREVIRPKLNGTLAIVLSPGTAGGATIFKSFESRPPGDADGNFVRDSLDFDMIAKGIRSREADIDWLDVNSDGVVSELDKEYWITDISKTYLGDANLDGEFNTGDLIVVFQASEYEDAIALNSGWAEGDWDGDGDFTTSDLVAAFTDDGYERGPRLLARAVPEPKDMVMTIVLVAVAVSSIRRLHRRF